MNNFSSVCSRREFLRCSAAVAGGALAARHLPAAFAATTTQIGAQLYTVRDACKADFAGALKKVAELGYRGVQVSSTYGKPAEEIRKMCDDYGLAILATHVSLEEFEKGLETILHDLTRWAAATSPFRSWRPTAARRRRIG
jgi:hypothetical protein